MPQINTRTYARAVIAVLGLAACSGASTSEPTTTTVSIDSGASRDTEKLLRSDFANSFTRGFEAVGLTITADQANCMANGLLNEFSRDELDQLMLDSVAGKVDDPAVLDRGAHAILGCLPAEVAAELASRNS